MPTPMPTPRPRPRPILPQEMTTGSFFTVLFKNYNKGELI